MTPCLTPEEFVDAAEGRLTSARAAHLEACAACRDTLEAMCAALAEVASVDVPEPSPFFWPSLNARVRSAVDAAGPAGGARRWRWQVVAPLGALAVVVVGVLGSIDWRATAPAPVPAVVVGAVEPPNADEPIGRDDDALALVADLAETSPGDAWDTLGVSALPEMGEAARALSLDEQRALAALLRLAVDRPAS